MSVLHSLNHAWYFSGFKFGIPYCYLFLAPVTQTEASSQSTKQSVNQLVECNHIGCQRLLPFWLHFCSPSFLRHWLAWMKQNNRLVQNSENLQNLRGLLRAIKLLSSLKHFSVRISNDAVFLPWNVTSHPTYVGAPYLHSRIPSWCGEVCPPLTKAWNADVPGRRHLFLRHVNSYSWRHVQGRVQLRCHFNE